MPRARHLATAELANPVLRPTLRETPSELCAILTQLEVDEYAKEAATIVLSMCRLNSAMSQLLPRAE